MIKIINKIAGTEITMEKEEAKYLVENYGDTYGFAAEPAEPKKKTAKKTEEVKPAEPAETTEPVQE